MVAKESRFVEDINDEKFDYLRSHRSLYHKSFMLTQAVAAKFANMFNRCLDEFVQLRNVRYPTIKFVDPLIFELEDRDAVKASSVSRTLA